MPCCIPEDCEFPSWQPEGLAAPWACKGFADVCKHLTAARKHWAVPPAGKDRINPLFWFPAGAGWCSIPQKSSCLAPETTQDDTGVGLFQSLWRLDGDTVVVNQSSLRNVLCFPGGFVFFFPSFSSASLIIRCCRPQRITGLPFPGMGAGMTMRVPGGVSSLGK